MPGMLYYPFADAPGPVINQAVLYWDSLSTVVAPGWRQRMRPAMRELLATDLYRPIEPYDAYEPVPLAVIEPELDFALAQIPLDDLIPPHNAPDEHARTLHVDKLHPSVVRSLLRRELVYRHPGSPSRLVGSTALMHLVVSIVADQIAANRNARFGGQGPLGLHPHTDVPSAHRLGADPIPGRETVAGWKVDIGALFPVPQGDISIGDLVAFREKYADERVRLMVTVQDLLHSLRDLHPDDVFLRVKHEIEEAVCDLHRAARARKLTLVKQSVAVTVATATAAVAVGLPEAALPASVLTVLGGIAVNVATNQTRYDHSCSAGNPSAYRYLHRVQKQ
ncbi:DUF6236 family protein [Micromonospora tulbaghiae]|uniref:DUF6236 family protein n=1 Tax=Micromonospora tulbaghiae TaxID=479978 RepID=UPI003722939C